MEKTKFIVPPTEIDLSQMYSEAQAETIGDGFDLTVKGAATTAAPTPEQRIRDAVYELVTMVKTLRDASLATFDQTNQEVNAKFDQMTENVNNALNGLDRNLEALKDAHSATDLALDSFIKVVLFQDKMTPESLYNHGKIISAFIQADEIIPPPQAANDGA